MSYKIYGQHDDRTMKQMETCMATGSAAAGVLCADGHLGYAHPIGGVVGYTDHISISGVGFDIACGNMAVRLDTPAAELKPRVATILQDIAAVVSFGVGRKNDERIDHDLFDSDLWGEADVEDLKSMARAQLGTVGSGNHYVDLFEDEAGATWIGVHFGSRGLGHKITTKYLAMAGAKDGMEVPPALLEADSDQGRGYLAGTALGGLYAYAGREWVVEKVRQIIGGNVTFSVHNHHNFAWRETHGGVDMWVVRKGATPAFPGQYGFVGGSMGDDAVILRGVDNEESRAALYSTVHGAGRVMSRTEARGRFVRDPETGKKVRQPGKVRHDEWQAWLADKGVTVLGGDLDEAPQAYRRLPDVLAEHAGTISIEHTLRPFGVIMAGKSEKDPYKD
ncbi:RNA-splicing ligase RtcB [Falsochrobactrum shanghaiense]|uniref:3'-phosphate/5'-hydroxy nucleic acid ligase n=1 Tax=Falsochrobactrum shanghaiense TaxID=2201899 RepID=A0A316JBV4_9HYPH|nr:RtcB family protein [Falsochrobactrum shanghaiense]PWL18846.1 RNA-splicing ligase RtcB [Falsochrobactrum shanghaiense]